MWIGDCGLRSEASASRSHALRGNARTRRSASPRPDIVYVIAILAAPLAPFANAEDKFPFATESLRGHVVYLAEAFEKQTGVRSVPEAKERILALQTKSGELIPLLEDVRARAFRRDQRLRDMELELTVRRYRHVPTVQILRVVEVAKDGRYEIDYWCDICSIVLFEDIPCECCQGPVELRRRKIAEP